MAKSMLISAFATAPSFPLFPAFRPSLRVHAVQFSHLRHYDATSFFRCSQRAAGELLYMRGCCDALHAGVMALMKIFSRLMRQKSRAVAERSANIPLVLHGYVIIASCLFGISRLTLRPRYERRFQYTLNATLFV